MLTASSQFKTEKPGKYLVQLCKHFAHKVDVSYTEQEGKVNFPGGMALLNNKEDCLEFYVEAATEEQLEICQSVIESHIVRFAFREKLESLNWEVS